MSITVTFGPSVTEAFAGVSDGITEVTDIADSGILVSATSTTIILESRDAGGTVLGRVTVTGTGITFNALGDLIGGTFTEIDYDKRIGGTLQDYVSLTNLTLSAPTVGAVIDDEASGADNAAWENLLFPQAWNITGTSGADILSQNAKTSDGVNIDLTNADKISLLGGNDVVFSSGGNDKLYGGSGKDKLGGEMGNDSLYGGSWSDTLYGGSGTDKLFGGEGNDKMYGGTSGDVLRGDAGDDTGYGGSGKDKVYGNEGSDKLYGGSENDTLFGGKNADTLDGGKGNDVLNGDNGGDKLYGGDGKDKLLGGDSLDKLYGGIGEDILSGNKGNDKLYGGQYQDTLYGGSGADVLEGNKGKDFLFGGTSGDVLKGNTGNDTMTGGSGADTFDFTGATQGNDVITDWEDGTDKLSGITLAEVSLTYSGGDTIITHNDGTITIDGQVITLDSGDFV